MSLAPLGRTCSSRRRRDPGKTRVDSSVEDGQSFQLWTPCQVSQEWGEGRGVQQMSDVGSVGTEHRQLSGGCRPEGSQRPWQVTSCRKGTLAVSGTPAGCVAMRHVQQDNRLPLQVLSTCLHSVAKKKKSRASGSTDRLLEGLPGMPRQMQGSGDGSATLHSHGDLKEALGALLWISSAQAVVAIWGGN